MPRALARRLDTIRAAELPRWERAWGTFWDRVWEAEPEADAALQRLHLDTPPAESGDPLAWPEAVTVASDTAGERWIAELEAELGPDPLRPAWERWASDVYERLPKCPDDPADLALWPHTAPAPPVDPPDRTDRERAFFLARLAEPEGPGPELAAASFLVFLRVVSELRALR